MKKTTLILAMLALGSSSFAQTNAPQAAPAAPAPTSAAPAVDPAKLALARDVISAMQADKMFDGMAAQMKQMAMQMSPLPADATPEQKARAEKFLGRIMDLSMTSAKAMIAQMDQVYAELFTEGELKAIKAFYTSPEGQSMIAKTPQAMQRVMPAIQAMQRDLMPKLQQ
ncbi:MAG TPA: DUF2059 domain-containing protein, partial [Acidobacteriota bacterium]|nr:DUF2059 domain-containing protein [Acidobacteriota bacterium]